METGRNSRGARGPQKYPPAGLLLLSSQPGSSHPTTPACRGFSRAPQTRQEAPSLSQHLREEGRASLVNLRPSTGFGGLSRRFSRPSRRTLRGAPNCNGSVIGGASGEEPVCWCRRHKRCELSPWVGKIPWRRAWKPTPIFLPGKSHGRRSLAGYSP